MPARDLKHQDKRNVDKRRHQDLKHQDNLIFFCRSEMPANATGLARKRDPCKHQKTTTNNKRDLLSLPCRGQETAAAAAAAAAASSSASSSTSSRPERAIRRSDSDGGGVDGVNKRGAKLVRSLSGRTPQVCSWALGLFYSGIGLLYN